MADMECYPAIWREPQNVMWVITARERLHSGIPMMVTVQPGDGTRYQFLLVPSEGLLTGDFMDCGRDFGDGEQYRPTLFVTVMNGLGNGTANIMAMNGIDGIRDRIWTGMEIRNQCTKECLAQTVFALWSKEYEPYERA